MNVRAAHWFLEAPYLPQRERLISWLDAAASRKLLTIEIGAGFNTPGVIRWPVEQITSQHADAKMIRVNPNNAKIPRSLLERSLSMVCGGQEFVAAVFAR